MAPSKYHDDLIPRDTAEDDSSLDTGTDLPLSEIEIEDLLYGEGRSLEERLELLRTLRDDLAERGGADFGDDDPNSLRREIEARIAELEGEADGSGGVVFDSDPLAHRETLAPDSDELEALDEEEEASLDEEDEWLDAEEEAGDRTEYGRGDGADDEDEEDLEDEEDEEDEDQGADYRDAVDEDFEDDEDDLDDEEDEGDIDNDDDVAR